MTTSRSSWH